MNAARRGLARRLFALVLVTASGGLLASACADNESSLFIRMRIVPDEGCTTECSPDESFLTYDEVDAAYPGGYSHSAVLLVGNQMVQRGDSDVLRTETSRVQLYAAEVRILDNTGSMVGEYEVPVSGTVDPGSSDDPGYNCTEVLMIDGATMDELRTRMIEEESSAIEVVSTVILKGRTLGGQEMETVEWAYPIRVCLGCSGCIDHAPECCSGEGAGSEACEDLDAVAPTCPRGRPGVTDCRQLLTSCSEHLADVRSPP
ncbi:hypothetical protein SOCE26_098050 [Sorangium cellulosum]|uniref:Secreted protein n=1 Tax=Sorangium cellulosum TaxID=56 RepID=A0A2L0F9Q8_SORCE|nr:hypothetical protein [Sorangium cellulosum]AUX48273.1 hypothetical protein SOCE26_098050 [Sorangium cellulosum]